jgi:hypothetical protein
MKDEAYFTGACPVKLFEKDSEADLTRVAPENGSG